MSYVHLILDDGLIAHKVKQHWKRRIIPFKPIDFWSCKKHGRIQKQPHFSSKVKKFPRQDCICCRVLDDKLPHLVQSTHIYICLTSLTRAKCGTRSTLCWEVGNISGSTELFAL